MYKELIRNKCIDISRLLLLRAKELQINDNECHILMLVYTISLNNLEQKLLQENNKTEEVETEVNLISVFEEQFARALSPIELNIIKDWKNCEYSDEMIIKALKEAVKSQVLNFRYIEGILSNWAKNGIKQRYIEQEEPKRAVPISEYKWWENE